jgi:hypothetical protein
MLNLLPRSVRCARWICECLAVLLISSNRIVTTYALLAWECMESPVSRVVAHWDGSVLRPDAVRLHAGRDEKI